MPRAGRARFDASFAGIGEMLRSPWMEAEMRRRATLIKNAAVATAPVQTGRYKSSFHVDSGRRGGFKKDRAYGEVSNSDPAAVHIEFGTSDTPAHYTLTRAVAAARD